MGSSFDVKAVGNDHKSLEGLLDATHTKPGLYDSENKGFRTPGFGFTHNGYIQSLFQKDYVPKNAEELQKPH